MNKIEFIEKLEKKLNYDKNTCEKINNIIENTFLVGKKNKEKMINSFIEELNIKYSEAEKIYETVMEIISNNLKEKIKHPFKNLDK